MTYVIAEPCIDVKDKSCIEECPVDCIYEGDRMLYIQPDECVDCGACEPVCPVEAIFYEDDVPAQWKDFTQANAAFFTEGEDPLGSPRRRRQDWPGRARRRLHRQLPRHQVTGMRYRFEVRLTPADVGQRVVIRWRRPVPGNGEEIADILGTLEACDVTTFAVRRSDGELVLVPAERALAGKTVPLAPVRPRRAAPKPPTPPPADAE